MIGQQTGGRDLFNYAVNLEKPVRSDHRLRRVAVAIDFGFVQREVENWQGETAMNRLRQT
jgi:hypothetical protein